MGNRPIPIERLAHELREAERHARMEDFQRALRDQQNYDASMAERLRDARLAARKWKATCFVVAGLGVTSHFWRWVLEVML